GEGLAGSDSLAGERGVDELGEHVHAGAGASDGNAAGDERVEFGFNGSAFPEIDVVGLVAAGDPEGFGVLDGGDDEGVAGHVAVGDDEGGDGVFVGAELLDVRIVGVGAGGADDEEIAVAAAGAHPLEGGVDVGAAAHEHGAGGGGGGYVVLVADAEIGILFGGESGNCAEYKDG